jgi:chemotaxis signal transduction protein
VPGAKGSRAVLDVAGSLVPVVFGRMLLGEATITLAPTNMVVILESGDRSAALWVDRIHDIETYSPWRGDQTLGGEVGDYVAAFSAGPPAVPVLDVPALVAAAHAST